MTIQEAKALIIRALQNNYESVESNAIAIYLIQHITGLSHSFQIIEKDFLFNEIQEVQLSDAIEKLSNFIPIDYIIGEKEFLDITLKVNNNVLIPRPETEELVEWIKQDNAEKSTLTILDIGTGSGCIALALKKSFPNAIVHGIDISEKAITTAKENALYNNLNVDFKKVDVFSDELTDKYDIIVSNPPYIRQSEKEMMHNNVLNHEPHSALFVPDNHALIFYKEIIKKCDSILNSNGWLYFEINEAFGEEMISLFKEYDFHDIDLKKDLFDKNRMIRGRK